jgi:hypothetical protein
MTYVVAGFAALVLFGLPLLIVMPGAAVLVGGIAALLTVIGLALRRRGPLTVAACMFLANYTVALWVTGVPVDLTSAVGEGLALLLLLQTAELSRASHRATVDHAVVRSQVVGWAVFGAGTLVTAGAVMTVAYVLAGRLPFAFAPVVAAAGALGIVVALTGIARSHAAQ